MGFPPVYRCSTGQECQETAENLGSVPVRIRPRNTWRHKVTLIMDMPILLMRATAGQQVVIASECLSMGKKAGTPARSGIALPKTEGLPGGTA